MSETQELQLAIERASKVFVIRPEWEYVGYAIRAGEQRKYYKDPFGNYYYKALAESDFKRW